jgi:transposase
MKADEYETLHRKQFSSTLGTHEKVIIDWLERFPDLSAAQVQDWIHEHYEEVYPERTVRNYVFNLRKKHGLTKSCKKEREYGCIPELPPGQQLQADFGEYWALRQDKRRIKVFLVAFILAHSRYKYILWQTRPFNAVDFVRSLESCFEEFGGLSQELVIDQDSLMVVSENNGDIIHTYEFERCKNRHGFSVWLCRKADPESKGYV